MPPLPAIDSQELVGFALVVGRVGGLFLLAPVFSSRLVPARVRALVAAAFALALAPLATEGRQLPAQALDLALVLVKEILVGLAFALAVGAVAAILQAAAELLDVLVGFAYAQLVDPMTGAQGGPMARLYSMLGAIVFLLVGGDHLVVLGLARSYEVLPLDAGPDPAALAAMAASQLPQIALAALEVAAPVLVALVLADIALALVARAVPQMNVFFVGLPAKILLGLAVCAAALPFVARHVLADIDASLEQGLAALAHR